MSTDTAKPKADGAESLSTAELERLIRKAGWSGIYTQWVSPTERESMTVPVTPEQVRKFAELVALAEREACANVAEEFEDDMGYGKAQKIADKIRMRSNVELTGAGTASALNAKLGVER